MSNAQPETQAPTPHAKVKARLIVNPHSWHGTGNSEMLDHICRTLGARGIDADPALTTPQDHGAKLAQAAVAQGYKLVIAVGGDGTVHDVAEGLLGTGVCLGIIPFGTMNNVATSLHIPTDLEAACEIIADQRCQAIDVGMLNGKPFLEAVSIGFAAPLFPLAEQTRHHGIFGLLKAAYTGLRLLAQMRPHAMTMELDGRRKKVRAQEITICNMPRYGLGFIAAPDARIDDGLLDIVVTKYTRRRDLFVHYWSIMTGQRKMDTKVRMQRARRVRITSRKPLPVAADGEVAGNLPVTVAVAPRRLKVCVGNASASDETPTPPVVTILRTIAPPEESNMNIYPLPERVHRLQRLAWWYWIVAPALGVGAWLTRRLGWWNHLPKPKPAPEIAAREQGRSAVLTALPLGLAGIFWRLRMHLEALGLLATGGMGIITGIWRRVARRRPGLVEPDDATMRAVAGMGVLTAGLWASRKPTWRRHLLTGLLGAASVWLSLAGRRSTDTPERERDSIALGMGMGALWLGGTLSLLAWVRQGELRVANVAELPTAADIGAPTADLEGVGDIIAPVAMQTELQRGDLILFGPDGSLGSRMIEFLTHSHYHHMAIYDGEGMVIEAMPGGVRRYPLGTRRITAIRLSVTEEQRTVAADWARGHVGGVYDTRGLFLIAFDRLFPGLRIGGAGANRFTCAVFAADAYLQAGVDLLPHHRWEDLVPGDFIYLIDTFPKPAR